MRANEFITESKERCQQCGMTNCSCKPGTCKCKPIAGWIPNKGFKKDVTEDWNKVNKKDKTDGLSQKAVNAYRRENPGSKLKTAVTTKPSKLKAGSKAAKRRKSFCARMSGNKGPMKKPNGKPTPKALALRRWNCESVEQMAQMIAEGEQMISEMRAREFLREENYGESANIDWEKFRAGMTALAMDQEELQGYQGVDAIVFLGLMGDPSPRSRPINIRLQSPARIVVLNAAGVDLMGKSSGRYLDTNQVDYRDYPDRPDFDGRAQERKVIAKDYDIAVSHKNFDPAFDARRTDALDTLAHEARHRGFRILWETPEIMSKIPQPLRDSMQNFIKHNDGEIRDSYEHLMIYAVSMGTTRNAIGPDKDSFFRSKEEYYKYRRDYKIVEQAAKSYVMSMKVTPGGLAALRNEVDKMTPKDEVIKIVPGPTGAVAVGTTPVKASSDSSAVAVGTTPVKASSDSKEKSAVAVQPANVTAPVSTAATTSKAYTVQRGDTLGRIAQRFYKGQLSDLLRANPQFTSNGRNPNLIYPGDKVKVPG